MKKVVVLFLGLGVVFVSALTAVASRTEPSTPTGISPTLSVSLIADGFDQPTDIANAGDDRLFIVERDGIIHIIDGEQNVLPTPFLDIEDQVDSQTHSERGMLSLAFHPDYPNTPYFYVNYINNDGNTVLSRFTADDATNTAVSSSELILLTITQPARNHNGGDLNFGPDGYLYIATGDGGSAGDPFGDVGNGQETETLLGKILRIDVDNGTPYAIPADNPFVNDPNTYDEIWALGLRNPWRFSFDRQTGDMFIADVGQGEWEEVNFSSAESTGGENFGWRCYEGNHVYNTSGCADMSTYQFPFYEYPHDNDSNDNDEGISVTGGFVYRGQTHPDLQGIYLFGDFASANVWLASPDGGGGWNVLPNGPISGLSSISTFGEGCSGELFVAGYGGQIFQIETAVTNPPPTFGSNQLFLPLIFQGNGPTIRACTS